VAPANSARGFLAIEGTPAEKIYLVNQYDELGGLTPFLTPFRAMPKTKLKNQG
jgi:hypothetical protein